MKKFYALFTYDHEEYVIRFRILQEVKCISFANLFRTEDGKEYWTKMAIMMAANGDPYHWPYPSERYEGACYMLTHEEFKTYRAHGYKRWKPLHEIVLLSWLPQYKEI